MATNVIELVQKYIPELDYQYASGAKTAILDSGQELIRQTQDAKTILIPKMHLTGLRNYDRNTGFKMGAQTLTWESHTFTQDRQNRFVIDALDNIEALDVPYAHQELTNQAQNVIPELDAYRFSTYATKAGLKNTDTPSKTNAVTLIENAITAMDEAEVPEEGRVLFVSNAFYNLMKLSSEIQKKMDVVERNEGDGVSLKIETYNNMPIVKVPGRRFKTAYTFLDTEAGGFEPTVDAKDINFMIVHPSAVMQITKRAVSRFFAPTPEIASQTGAWGVSQNMDGWDIQSRIYHDAFVLGNKTEGIYVNHNA